MPRLTKRKKGKRVNIWIPDEHMGLWKQLDNKSQFVQKALDEAVGVMAMAIIKQEKGLVRRDPTETELADFNRHFPLDPLTQKRTKQTWPNTPNLAQKPALKSLLD